MKRKPRRQTVRQATVTGAYIACPQCDSLQHELKLPSRGVAICQRCGVELYHNAPYGLDRTLAFALCGVVLYCLANLFPLLGLDLKGNRTMTTLYGAVMALYDQQLEPIAILVFVTTIFIPGLELCCVLYILLPLRFGKVASGFSLVFRLMQLVHPWGMIEVFMLGVLVSVVKLANFATVIPGIAVWSFAGLMLTFAALAQSFNPRDLWAFTQGKA